MEENGCATVDCLGLIEEDFCAGPLYGLDGKVSHFVVSVGDERLLLDHEGMGYLMAVVQLALEKSR